MSGVALTALLILVTFTRPASAEFLFNQIACVLGSDCEPPAAPVLVSPEDGAFQPSPDFTFEWQAVTDNDPITYQVCVAQNANFSGQSCSAVLSETSYGAANLIESTSASWYWRVLAIDPADNQTASEARQVTIDAENPTVELTTDLSVIGGNTPLASLAGKVQDTHLAKYDVSFYAPGDVLIKTQPFDATSTTEDVIASLDAVTPDRLPSGVYAAVLTAIDKAGRSGQITIPIEVDNTGPVIEMSGGNVIIKSGSIAPAVSLDDPRGIGTHTWTADEDNPEALAFDPNELEPSFTPVVEGTYLFSLTVADSFGNETTKTFQFGYKKELPPLPLPTETVTPTTNTSAVLPASVSPAASTPSRDIREESSDNILNQVLGATNTNTPIEAFQNVAAVTPTKDGWRILGILWYWWLMAIVGTLAVIAVVRRFMFTPRV